MANLFKKLSSMGPNNNLGLEDLLESGFLTFLAPGTNFVEDNFFFLEDRPKVRRGQRFRG